MTTDGENINEQVYLLIKYLVFVKYYELLFYFNYLIPPKAGLLEDEGALQTVLAYLIKSDSVYVEILRVSISSIRLRKLINLTS